MAKRKNKFPAHRVRVRHFRGIGYSLIVPVPAYLREKVYGNEFEMQIEEDGDMTKGQHAAVCGYIRRALAAYRKQGGRL